MTISTESAPDDGGKAGPPAPVPAHPELEPFAEATRAEAPRGIRARLLDYSAHAAMIVGLIGFAWTVGDHVINRPVLPDAPSKAATVRPTTTDPLAELRGRNQALADEVKALQARLDALQATVADHAAVSAQVHGLQAGLDGLKAGLGTARTEQTAAVARLDGKIDKLAHEPGSRIQQLVDRLGKLERSSVDLAPTASLPKGGEPESKNADARPGAATARPLPRPAELKLDAKNEPRTSERTPDAKSVDGHGDGGEGGKPPVLASWVVRGVYGGVALIEGRRGTLEVVPGVSIPGAGVVKSIDRHGGGWTVTTTKGLVAPAPTRDYRRADRGSYGYAAPDYGYDF